MFHLLLFYLLQRRQKRRLLYQRELAQKIVTGSWKIDYAIKRHKEIKEKEIQDTQNILDSKLKPKGHLLLKKK
jgi:large subunit ribosomal protein L52